MMPHTTEASGASGSSSGSSPLVAGVVSLVLEQAPTVKAIAAARQRKRAHTGSLGENSMETSSAGFAEAITPRARDSHKALRAPHITTRHHQHGDQLECSQTVRK